MDLTVGEIARLAGVSVRTLHYYDEIGLLHPAEISSSGYRRYGDAEISKLQQIVYLKKMGLSLSDVKRALDSSDYDKLDILKKHRELLVFQAKRLADMIELVDQLIKGEITMEKHRFDTTKEQLLQQQYAQEAKARWGNTDAFQEYCAREHTTEYAALSTEMEKIFFAFSALRETDPAAPEAANLVKKWQNYITEHFYTCTDQTLLSLADLYEFDQRFQATIDKVGEGTSVFMAKAIRANISCKI